MNIVKKKILDTFKFYFIVELYEDIAPITVKNFWKAATITP